MVDIVMLVNGIPGAGKSSLAAGLAALKEALAAAVSIDAGNTPKITF